MGRFLVLADPEGRSVVLAMPADRDELRFRPFQAAVRMRLDRAPSAFPAGPDESGLVGVDDELGAEARGTAAAGL